jgi:hypothetical protein
MGVAEQNYFIADIFCDPASKFARSTLILAGPNRVNVVYKGMVCKCWNVGGYVPESGLISALSQRLQE